MSGIWVVHGPQRFQIPAQYKSGSFSSLKRAACKHFNLVPKEWILIGPNGKISNSASVKAARLSRGTKLKLQRKPSAPTSGPPARPPVSTSSATEAKSSDPSDATTAPETSRRRASQEETCSIALYTMDTNLRYDVVCPLATSLWDVLEQVERKYSPLDLTHRRAQRGGEGNAPGIQITYNRSGDLRPILTFAHRKFNTREEMETTTLNDVGAGSAALMRLKFEYVADPMTAEEEANLQNALNDAFAVDAKERDLDVAEPMEIDENFERDPRVILPPQTAFDTSRYELPEEFYDLDITDIEKIKDSIRRVLPEYRQSHPERASKQISDFRKTIIRVRLPSERAFLEGNFRVLESIGDVRQFVKDSIVEQNVELTFFVSPPKTILSDDSATLQSLNLVPRAIINLKIPSNESIHLKSELRDNAVILSPPEPTVPEKDESERMDVDDVAEVVAET